MEIGQYIQSNSKILITSPHEIEHRRENIVKVPELYCKELRK